MDCRGFMDKPFQNIIRVLCIKTTYWPDVEDKNIASIQEVLVRLGQQLGIYVNDS